MQISWMDGVNDIGLGVMVGGHGGINSRGCGVIGCLWGCGGVFVDGV